jgi:hypothetical protein
MASKRNLDLCGICKGFRLKETVQNRKVGKYFYSVCEECYEELKLTRTCMEISTDWMCRAKRFKKSYIKTSPISVTQVE